MAILKFSCSIWPSSQAKTRPRHVTHVHQFKYGFIIHQWQQMPNETSFARWNSWTLLNVIKNCSTAICIYFLLIDGKRKRQNTEACNSLVVTKTQSKAHKSLKWQNRKETLKCSRSPSRQELLSNYHVISPVFQN